MSDVRTPVTGPQLAGPEGPAVVGVGAAAPPGAMPYGMVWRDDGGRRTVPGNRWDLLPPPPAPPTVSVVIPHFEQPEDLERVLHGLSRQRGAVHIVDVIVADDGSSTPPALGLDHGLPLLVVRHERAGRRPAATRNLGAAAARGDVLVFLDADTVPAPDCIARLAALPAVAPEVVAVGRRRHHDLTGWDGAALGRWLAGRTGDGPPALEDPAWLRDGYRRSGDLLRIDDRSWQWIISALLACSRSFFEELGGFDGTLVGYSAEDWELAHRAYAAGAILAHVPDAVGIHHGGDWRERSGPDAHKNDERIELAQRVPGRRDPIIGPYAALVVRVPATSRPADELVRTICSLLERCGAAVRVVLSDDVPAAVASLLAGDRRVVLGAVDPQLAARSLAQLDLRALVELDDGALDRLLDAVAPAGPGAITLSDEQGPLGRLVSTRALARAARWADVVGGADAALEALFGRSRLDGAVVGVHRLSTPVDLDRALPR